MVEKERQLLKTDFEGELHAVQRHYMTLGVTEETAMAIARDLLTKNHWQPLSASNMICN